MNATERSLRIAHIASLLESMARSPAAFSAHSRALADSMRCAPADVADRAMKAATRLSGRLVGGERLVACLVSAVYASRRAAALAAPDAGLSLRAEKALWEEAFSADKAA